MENKKIASYQLIVLIATPKLVDSAAEMFSKKNLPVQFRLSAEGTASSEIMDALGLGSIDKGILISGIPKTFSREMLKILHTELKLDSVNSGIAFTIPITAASKLMFNMMKKIETDSLASNIKKGDDTMDTDYTLITAIVDRGFGSDVMDIARTAGAGGGTIMHSRAIENEVASGFWGLSVQEEKEIVMIIAEHDLKIPIMTAIGEKFGIHSEAKGLVISLPIDNIMGI